MGIDNIDLFLKKMNHKLKSEVFRGHFKTKYLFFWTFAREIAAMFSMTH